MSEKVVASANGYYVYECAEAGAPGVIYEVRRGMECVKRYADLGEAERFIKLAYERDEDSYRE